MKTVVGIALAVAAAFFFSCPEVSDGHLLKRRRPICPETCPIVIGPCAESPMEPIPVQQPSLPLPTMEPPSLPQQATALDPVKGTGSRLPIGPLAPNVTLKIEAETLEKLRDLMRPQSPMIAGNITHTLDAVTSPLSPRQQCGLELLLWLATAVLGHSAIGKFGPWVVPVASGLRYVALALLQAKGKTQEDTSSTPTKPS